MSSSVRNRKQAPVVLTPVTAPSSQAKLGTSHVGSTNQPSSITATSPSRNAQLEMNNLNKQSQWIVLAIASGACASFNGVFAKLYVYVHRSL